MCRTSDGDVAAYERKVDLSGAVSGAVVAPRPTKTNQDTDILGGPGRTRTCNQTVMSGGISIGFVDFAALLFDFDCVRCISIGLFLERNWCGPKLAAEGPRHGRASFRYPKKAEVIYSSQVFLLVSPESNARSPIESSEAT